MVQQSFDMSCKVWRGVTQDDIDNMAEHYKSNDRHVLAKLLGDLLLSGESGADKAIDEKTPNSLITTHYVIFTRRPDGKYDLLVVLACQKKKLDQKKIASAVGGSIAV